MAIKEKHFCQTKNGLYTPAVEMKVICRTESRVLLMCNYAFCVVKTGCALSLSLSLIVGKASESDYNFKRLITKICLSCKKKNQCIQFWIEHYQINLPFLRCAAKYQCFCKVVHGISCAFPTCPKCIVFLKHVIKKKTPIQSPRKIHLQTKKNLNRFDKTWLSVKLSDIRKASTLTLFGGFFLWSTLAVVLFIETFVSCMPIARKSPAEQ